MSALLPVEEAVRRVTAGAEPVAAETVPLAEAAGRILAAPLAARRTQPPFDASAMDGYAVRSADFAGVLPDLAVIGMAAAGEVFAGALGSGQAVRIFTGAPLPAGADAVLIQENAEARAGGRIHALAPVAAGQNVRAVGLDFRAGEELLAAGRRLGPRELALAAAMNHGAVPVRRRPRVAIFATGNELVPPGTADPGPGRIIASNFYGLAGFVAELGAEPLDLGIVLDDRAAIGAAIDRAVAAGADVLVTTGGASVGDHDLVRPAFADRGMALDFWRIALRPGKPLVFGRLGALRVLGMPGNPVSTLVCSILFLRPLVRALLAMPEDDVTEPAVLGAPMPENDHRQDYVRAALASGGDGLPVATPLGRQDSSMLATLGRAGCLVLRDPHAPTAAAGAPVRIIRLDRQW